MVPLVMVADCRRNDRILRPQIRILSGSIIATYICIYTFLCLRQFSESWILLAYKGGFVRGAELLIERLYLTKEYIFFPPEP